MIREGVFNIDFQHRTKRVLIIEVMFDKVFGINRLNFHRLYIIIIENATKNIYQSNGAYVDDDMDNEPMVVIRTMLKSSHETSKMESYIEILIPKTPYDEIASLRIDSQSHPSLYNVGGHMVMIGMNI